VNHLEAKAI
jgi:hypothetical protein